MAFVSEIPLPPFDGYRIVALALGKKKLLGLKLIDMVIYFIVACFLLNLLPWVWS